LQKILFQIIIQRIEIFLLKRWLILKNIILMCIIWKSLNSVWLLIVLWKLLDYKQSWFLIWLKQLILIRWSTYSLLLIHNWRLIILSNKLLMWSVVLINIIWLVWHTWWTFKVELLSWLLTHNFLIDRDFLIWFNIWQTNITSTLSPSFSLLKVKRNWS